MFRPMLLRTTPIDSRQRRCSNVSSGMKLYLYNRGLHTLLMYLLVERIDNVIQSLGLTVSFSRSDNHFRVPSRDESSMARDTYEQIQQRGAHHEATHDKKGSLV